MSADSGQSHAAEIGHLALIEALLHAWCRPLGVEGVLRVGSELDVCFPPEKAARLSERRRFFHAQGWSSPTIEAGARAVDPLRSGVSSPLTLGSYGPCLLTVWRAKAVDSSDLEEISRGESPHAQMTVLCRALAALAPALESADPHSERAAYYYHSLLMDLTPLASNLAALLDQLPSPFSPTRQRPDEVATTGPQVNLEVLAELAAVSSFLANEALDSAANFLALLMPHMLPSAGRESWRDENPIMELEALLPLYALVARKRRIAFVYDQSEQSSEMPRVRVESSSWRRVLSNVLSNALKYSYRGFMLDDASAKEREIRIWCSPRHDAHGVFCSVTFQNYGYGVEPDEIGRVFEPGYRGRKVRQAVPGGTGLGLSECHRVVGGLGGMVEFRSELLHDDTYLTTVRLVLRRSERST